jgi:small-conductance mechanosensitive channel
MPSFTLPAIPPALDSPWILAPIVFVLWVVVFLVVEKVVLRAIRGMASRTSWTWDDVLLESLSPALLIAIVASGFFVCGRILPFPPEVDRAFDVMLAAAVALALVVFVDRIARGLLDRMAAGSSALQGARGLILGGTRGLIIAIGLLIFLDSVGISITPLLASLGIGSLAVALALQDTLNNLFAGIYMLVDKPIEAGHFVRLESGEEGFVTRVGWRSTWIRMPTNSMVVVPNAKLAGSVITNYSLPASELSVNVEAGVHYASDLERVERVTLEVAREALRTVEGAVPTFEPSVRYTGFGESSIMMTAVLRARDFQASAVVRHEFVRRLQARYRREGIVFPFPTRTLDLPPPSQEEIRHALGADAGGQHRDA